VYTDSNLVTLVSFCYVLRFDKVNILISMKILDRPICITPCYGAGRPTNRSWIPGKIRKFSLLQSIQNSPGSTHSPSQWMQVEISQMVKRPGHEVDHSFPYSARFRTPGGRPTLPLYCLVSNLRTRKPLHKRNMPLLISC
jgi:hypothetical protein